MKFCFVSLGKKTEFLLTCCAGMPPQLCLLVLLVLDIFANDTQCHKLDVDPPPEFPLSLATQTSECQQHLSVTRTVGNSCVIMSVTHL